MLTDSEYVQYLDVLKRYNTVTLTKETQYLKKVNIVTMFTIRFLKELEQTTSKDASYKFIRSLIKTSNHYTILRIGKYRVIEIGKYELQLFIKELKDYLGDGYSIVINDEVVAKYLSDIKLLTLFLVMRHKLLN